jgi:hypothetical protein
MYRVISAVLTAHQIGSPHHNTNVAAEQEWATMEILCLAVAHVAPSQQASQKAVDLFAMIRRDDCEMSLLDRLIITRILIHVLPHTTEETRAQLPDSHLQRLLASLFDQYATELRRAPPRNMSPAAHLGLMVMTLFRQQDFQHISDDLARFIWKPASAEKDTAAI